MKETQKCQRLRVKNNYNGRAIIASVSTAGDYVELCEVDDNEVTRNIITMSIEDFKKVAQLIK